VHPLLTRAQLAARIAAGETLVLHGVRIYRLDAWLKRHPGGELAILHFVGRDARDEIEAYHCDATLRRMRAFQVATLAPQDVHPETGYKPLMPPVQLGYRAGKLETPDAQWLAWTQSPQGAEEASKTGSGADDEPAEKARAHAAPAAERPQGFPLPVAMLEPPAPPAGIEPAREQAISKAYRVLHDEVKAAGLYTLRPAGYMRELSRYAVLFAAFVGCYAHGYFLLSSLCLGLFWHQVTFSAHDAGHSGITGNHAVDRAIGIFIASPLGGLSLGWWCDNHDVHHLVTNHPEHDPDIQHMPFFAINPAFLVAAAPSEAVGKEAPAPGPHGLWSTYYRRSLFFDAPARFFLKHQHALYYVVMSLGRFNLYGNSYGFLAKRPAHRRDRWWLAEVAGLGVFWAWFGACLAHCPDWTTRVLFVLISHIATSPLHVQVSGPLWPSAPPHLTDPCCRSCCRTLRAPAPISGCTRASRRGRCAQRWTSPVRPSSTSCTAVCTCKSRTTSSRACRATTCARRATASRSPSVASGASTMPSTAFERAMAACGTRCATSLCRCACLARWRARRHSASCTSAGALPLSSPLLSSWANASSMLS
jgi:delta8-fatty-acid desaturase